MSRSPPPLDPGPFEAPLYPAPPPPQGTADVRLGVCLSGGGSRALTCALGQLSGLRRLPDPGGGEATVLDRARYLSSVSGGSWAAVLYSFLPQSIDGREVTDDEFLITPTAPAELSLGSPHDPAPGNVAWLDRNSLGRAPQQWSVERIAELLYRLHRWKFFDHPEKWRWFWIAAVGELILRPFALYDASYPRRSDLLLPRRFFSLSRQHVEDTITPANPSLTADHFYTVRSGRPQLVVNTNLLQRVTEVDSPQIPVQATPTDSGVLGRSPDRMLVGGGSVESFGFTSILRGRGASAGVAAVSLPRRYSLCDIAGCSSAFFAEALLRYLNTEIDKVAAELERFLTRELRLRWLARIVARRVRTKLEPFLDAAADRLIPTYNYWPLGEVDEPHPANIDYGFSDGGDFENTGVLGMLARTDANRLVSFVNSETPLARDPRTHEILLAGQLALLFGYRARPHNGHWTSYDGMRPEEPMSYAQVFSDANGEFAALRRGLWEASCGGADRDDRLASQTAAFLQELTTVDNPVAAVRGRRRVKVLWIYNNRVNRWQGAISDPRLRHDLERGQAGQNTDGTPAEAAGAGSGPLANFPWYSTGAQIHLDPEAVNTLAQLSAWNVSQLAGSFADLLRP